MDDPLALIDQDLASGDHDQPPVPAPPPTPAPKKTPAVNPLALIDQDLQAQQTLRAERAGGVPAGTPTSGPGPTGLAQVGQQAEAYALAPVGGIAQGASDLNHAVNVLLNKAGVVSDEHLQDLEDQQRELGQFLAPRIDPAQGIPIGGGDRVLPASDLQSLGRTAAGSAPGLIPFVGPEVLAAMGGANAARSAQLAGNSPGEQAQAALAAALGSEVGFRGVPMVPELQAAGKAMGGAPGAILSRAVPGAATGAAQAATQPQGPTAQTIGMQALLSLLGAHPSTLPRGEEAASAPVDQAQVARSGAETQQLDAQGHPVDPSAITQEMDPVHAALDPNAVTREVEPLQGPSLPGEVPGRPGEPEAAAQRLTPQEGEIAAADAQQRSQMVLEQRVSDLEQRLTQPVHAEAVAEADRQADEEARATQDRSAEPAERARAEEEEGARLPGQLSDDRQAIEDAKTRQDAQWRQDFVDRMARGRAAAAQTAAKDAQWKEHVAQQLRQRRTGVQEPTQIENPYRPAPDIAGANDEAATRLAAVRSEEQPAAEGPTPLPTRSQRAASQPTPQEVPRARSDQKEVPGPVRQEEGNVGDVRDRQQAGAGPRDVQEEGQRPADEKGAGTPRQGQEDEDRLAHLRPAAKQITVPRSIETRLHERPELAIPSEDLRTREAFRTVDRAREVEPVTREEQAERGAKMAEKPEALEKRVAAKVKRKEPISAAEGEALHQLATQKLRAGDVAGASRMAELYRQGRTEVARSLGQGVDPLETVPQRAQRQAQDTILQPSQALGREIARAEATGDDAAAAAARTKAVADSNRVIAEAKRAGIDPTTLEDLPKAKRASTPKARTVAPKQRKQLDTDFAAMKEQLRKLRSGEIQGSSSAGADRIDLYGRMILNRAAVGVLKFADLVVELAKAIPGWKSDPNQQADLVAAWERMRAAHPGLNLAPSGEPMDALVDNVRQRTQKLVDQWAAKHADAMKATPEDRADLLMKKRADNQVDKDLHAQVGDLMASKKALQDAIHNRDVAVMLNHDRVAKIAQRVKGDAWDVAYEWNRSAIHTALGLPLKKVASDVANSMINFVQRPIAETLKRGPGSIPAIAGETAAIVKATIPAFHQGILNAMDTWSAEESAFNQQVRRAQIQRTLRTGEELPRAALHEFGTSHLITNKAAKLIRWNIRLVGAIQDLAETVLARTEVAANALKSGQDAGLAGDALGGHIEREMADLTSDSWKQGIATAQRVTGVESHEGGPAAFINKLKNSDPHVAKTDVEYAIRRAAKEGARYTFPFVTLPFNFLRSGVMMSPLGTGVMLARMAGHLGGMKYDTDVMARDAAHQLIGYAVTAAVAPYAGSAITGYTPWSPQAQDLTAPPAHSIKVLGSWHDYSGLGPLSHVIGTAADILQGVHDVEHGKGVGSALGDFASKFGDQITSESFLRSLKSISDMMHSQHRLEAGVASLLTTPIPTMVKEIAKAPFDTQQESRIQPTGFAAEEWYQVERQLGVRVSPPAVDIFGDELHPKGAGTTAGAAFLRLVNPFGGPDAATGNQDVKEVLLQHNDGHPDAPILPSEPEPHYTVRGVRQDMTPEQYHDLLVARGTTAATILRKDLASHPDLTQEQLPKLVHEVFGRAEQVARMRLRLGLRATETPEEPAP